MSDEYDDDITTEHDAPTRDRDAGTNGSSGAVPRNPDDERLSVVREAPPTGGGEGDDDEYQWHTGLNRPTGVPDAVEFVDVHKAFGRNKILRGLNMGLPEGKISMILGPSGTGKSVCI